MKPAPKIPYGGKTTVIFGLVLIAMFWVGTTQRSSSELSEAVAAEFSKNANLALALDVQTNQLLTGIDTLPATIYQFSTLPWEIDPLQVAVVVGIAMVLALGSTLLPSRHGARLDPAEALRYE